MLRILLIAFFAFYYTGAMAQLHLDDPNYIYQTTRQDTLSGKQVDSLLHSKQHYQLIENKMDNGKIMVTLLPITNFTFRQIIRKKKKMVMAMKGQKVPDYQLTSYGGEEMTNKVYNEAHVTVYNFWFTTCDHCIEEIPILNQVVKDFPENVNFVAPTFNTKNQVNNFLKDNKFDYTIIPNAKSLAKEMHIRSYPTHFIVDHTGTIKKVMIGSSNKVIKQLRKNIKTLLSQEYRTENKMANQ